ncbi:hypothetical protein PR048_009105 [Dryococelus australis]|uniref:Uncharacterized protein n=1 Tax=Dryococelus australis TaxID=614101 RepID=A0ABQ9HYZ3_9NEOP|nr:hypothetical protein PR048_009105 [Dryococelus australis]
MEHCFLTGKRGYVALMEMSIVKSHHEGKLHRKLVVMRSSSPLNHQEHGAVFIQVLVQPQVLKQHEAHQHPVRCPLERHHAIQHFRGIFRYR